MQSIWMIATYVLLAAGMARFFLSRREALLAASIVFALLLLLITEATSAVMLFSFTPILSAWIIATVLSAGFLIFARRKNTIARPAISADSFILACVGCIAIVLGIVGLTAVISPPNNWDTLSYHMSRVANWVQHCTVAHYQTQILRQLYLGPWAEFAVANLQILVGSDRLSAMVQFCAMAGNIVGVTAIAARLGASPRAQAMAALFAATIPIVVLESSNTQTDCVAAFWVVCAINFGLATNTKPSRAVEALFAAAIGLACLTKATTGVILFPFVVWMLIIQLRAFGIKPTARVVANLIVLPLLINSAHLYRNHVAFGSVLAPKSEASWYSNTIHTPGAIASSLMRNVLMNTPTRWTGRLTAPAIKLVKAISGLDPSDPRITYGHQRFNFFYSRDEHDAGNPIHLFLGTIGIAAAFYGFRKNTFAGIYAGCILIGFFLFCYQLKWQPWITRLQLPIFVIMAPLFGLLVDRVRSKQFTIGIAAILFVQSFVYLLYGMPRALTGPHSIFKTARVDEVFSKRPELRIPFQAAAKRVGESHPKFVALACGGDSWEYALRSQLPTDTAIVHIGVDNESKVCPSFAPADQPAWVVQLDDGPIPAAYSNYHVVYHQLNVALLIR